MFFLSLKHIYVLSHLNRSRSLARKTENLMRQSAPLSLSLSLSLSQMLTQTHSSIHPWLPCFNSASYVSSYPPPPYLRGSLRRRRPTAPNCRPPTPTRTRISLHTSSKARARGTAATAAALSFVSQRSGPRRDANIAPRRGGWGWELAWNQFVFSKLPEMVNYWYTTV